MDSSIRKFTLEETCSSEGVIVDAKGRYGWWPFRRAVSYHVGVNCDAIYVRLDLLHVRRGCRSIATAELLGAPSPWPRRLRTSLAAMLHPRHASRKASAEPEGKSPDVRWEHLLQPRDKNKR